ncbi:MAG TPA: hypothetical protein VG322_15620 [Candidatus Acidoferrales bacterium]|nr:hypothetical protein [Candidatus Acidoferrales bacterium]
MIGMNFAAFFTLLIVSFIAAIIMHSAIGYRVRQGADGFWAKWIVGWIGGWLGSPVFGHWWVHVGGVFIIPALLGAFAGAFLLAFLPKAQATVYTMAPKATSITAAPDVLRKVG